MSFDFHYEIAQFLTEHISAETLCKIKDFVLGILPAIDPAIKLAIFGVVGYTVIKGIWKLAGVAIAGALLYITLKYVGIDIAALI